MPKIAIIGGGPSGLAAAKSAKEMGLSPIIFEKTNDIGGIWKNKEGTAWASMRTNLSHFTCRFSDFAWEEPVEDFPLQKDVYLYLQKYTKHFKLESCIKFNCEVTKVEKDANNNWIVSYQNEQKIETEKFEFVIVSSGIFSKPSIPSIPGLDTYSGIQMHAKNYRSAEQFKDKKVLVVGGSYSGAEISADITQEAKQVINVVPKPFWIIPRHIPKNSDNQDLLLPVDLVFYKRASRNASKGLSAVEANSRRNNFFSTLCKGQNSISSSLDLSQHMKDPSRVVISDDYLAKVKENKIQVKSSLIKIIEKEKIYFEDGSVETPDVILFATGYRLDLPFFNEEIKNTLSYIEKDQLQPVLLHQCTFHPDLPNMAFVGVYRGPYFAVIELQARWANMIFSNQIKLPSREIMLQGIEEEKKIREQKPRLQFPHGDYIGFADSIAKEIGVLPDLEQLAQNDSSLHKILWETPVIPEHFRFFGSNSKPEHARTQSKNAMCATEPSPQFLYQKLKEANKKIEELQSQLKNLSKEPKILLSEEMPSNLNLNS